MSQTIVGDSWRSYRELVVPDKAEATQVQQTMLAFYAGAMVVYGVMLTIGSDEVTEDQGTAMLDAIGKECRAVLVAMEAEVASGGRES